MDLVNILKGGFERGNVSYVKNKNEYIVYQNSKIFWINTKNHIITCDSFETLKEIDKRCELGIFKTSEN